MMKTKILSILLLTALFSIVMVSATDLTIPASSINIPSPVNHDGGTFTITFDLENTGSAITDITFTNTQDPSSQLVIFEIDSVDLNAGTPSAPTTTTVTATGTYGANLNGKFKGTIVPNPGTGHTADTLPFEINITDSPSLSVSSATLTNFDTQTVLTVTNDGNIDFTIVNITSDFQVTGVTFDHPDKISILNAGTSKTVTVDIDAASLKRVGPNVATLTATDDDNPITKSEGTITIEKNFCDNGEQGSDLEIRHIDIINDDGDNEIWAPLDRIEVEVEVENKGSVDITEIMVELAVFDSGGRNIVNDFKNLDEEIIDLGRIKDGDEKTATFKFMVPADFEDDGYRLAIKVYSDDLGEEIECTAKQSDDLSDTYFQEIDGEREDDAEKHVIFHDIKVLPSPAQCGERIQVTGDLVNIGDKNYDSNLKVTLYNSELGLDLEQVIRRDLNEGRKRQVEFEFEVPEGAEEKLHTLKFRTYYDYYEDDDTYDEESDEEFRATLRVAGNCHVHTQDVSITAELDSETPQAIAGKQVIIKSTVTNTGNTETMYTLSVSGLDDWATLASIDDQVFTVAAGETKEVNIILNLDSDSEGDKEFTIKTTYGESGITEKKVPLSISASNAQLVPFVDNVKSNWFIYVIILVNVILIIAIISVIRSMVSPRPL